MRILSVAWSIPYPPDHATRIRAWYLLRRLAETEDVTVVTWTQPDTPPEHVEALRAAFSRVIALEVTPLDVRLPTRLARRARFLAGGLPTYIQAIVETRPLPADLGDDFDVAVAEDDGSLFAMPPVTCPKVVVRHNIFAETFRGLRGSRTLGWARFAKWMLEMGMWRRFDRLVAARADLSIVTTPEAAALARRLAPEKPVAVVPNGIELPARPVRLGARPVAVFLGTLSYEPNADAAVWFARSVWPRIAARVPGAELRIIGRDPLPAVRRVGGPGVRLLADVPDVLAACEGARVAVVPLRAGSGIKTKTLEFLSMGLPIVATPVGAEGIPAAPEDGLIVARDERALVEQTCALLSDPTRAAALGQAARRFVASTFSWEGSASLHMDLLRETVARPRRSVSA